MGLQRYELLSEMIKKEFLKRRREQPEAFKRKIDLSFCSFMFGLEDVRDSIKRLAGLGYEYIEIFGNSAGDTTGNYQYQKDTAEYLRNYNMKCSGLCLNFQPGFALESTDFFARQRAHDYIKRSVELCKVLGGSYCLITPAATGGRRAAADGGDYDRSVLALREISHVFEEYGIFCAIEPVAKHITPIVHTFHEAKAYIDEVGSSHVAYIYGDTEHMMAGEEHIGDAILKAGSMLLGLHLKDTQEQRPIGNGMLDVDTIIRALYLIGFNQEGRFVTGEPLPDFYHPVGGYGTMIRHDGAVLDLLAKETIVYFREREQVVLSE